MKQVVILSSAKSHHVCGAQEHVMKRTAQCLAFAVAAWAVFQPADLGAQQVKDAPPWTITHLYTDEKGESHFKDMQIKDGEKLSAVGVQLARRPAANNTFNQFHLEPVPRIIV